MVWVQHSRGASYSRQVAPTGRRNFHRYAHQADPRLCSRISKAGAIQQDLYAPEFAQDPPALGILAPSPNREDTTITGVLIYPNDWPGPGNTCPVAGPRWSLDISGQGR